LRDALVALAPDVDPGEAELVSVTAHTTSRSLAREYLQRSPDGRGPRQHAKNKITRSPKRIPLKGKTLMKIATTTAAT
jgi:hypothetical protein